MDAHHAVERVVRDFYGRLDQADIRWSGSGNRRRRF
jgi:hypothetical protein